VKKHMDEGALKPAFASGAEYVKWVGERAAHKDLRPRRVAEEIGCARRPRHRVKKRS